MKTPVGALALLAETLADEHDLEVVDRLTGRIQAEAQRIARIMDDLLDLSRIESEQLAPQDFVGVRSLVLEAVERMRAAADQRAIALTVGDLPANWRLVGDRRQLISALFNLLENAVKYSDPGSAAEVDAIAADRMIELRVSDHGIGIPAHETERIFERFYRVDQARARDTGGTGLGLAIVRHVVQNHGGDVPVESVEGQGSTFTLRLPDRPGPGAA
ncbi:MAG: sensor histidine kinase [Acidimicrobiales bacterium]